MQKLGVLLLLLFGMAGGKRPPESSAHRAQGNPKKKGKKTTTSANKPAVPDAPPLVDIFISSEENYEVFTDSARAVIDWSGSTMGPQAWGWLASNLSIIMNHLKSSVRKDTAKLTLFEKIRTDLIAQGWKAQASGWTFFDGSAVTSTKINKAIKSATAAADAFIKQAQEDESSDGGGGGRGGGDESDDDGEFVRRPGKEPAAPARGTREDDELPFDTTDFMDADHARTIPPFVRAVTHRTLRADQALDQRASAFGRGLVRPAEHQQASGVDGFNATFGCATTDFGEARILQENPISGAVRSVKVGAPKDYMGLLSLYNREATRLDNIRNKYGESHPHAALLREYLMWFMMEGVKYSLQPHIVAKFLEHDERFRERCSTEGFSVNIGTLNASWALAISELALTTIAHTHQAPFGQDAGRGRGGGGGGRGRGSYQSAQGSFQGGRGNPKSGRASSQFNQGGNQSRGGLKQSDEVLCHDFARGNCKRTNCKFKH